MSDGRTSSSTKRVIEPSLVVIRSVAQRDAGPPVQPGQMLSGTLPEAPATVRCRPSRLKKASPDDSKRGVDSGISVTWPSGYASRTVECDGKQATVPSADISLNWHVSLLAIGVAVAVSRFRRSTGPNGRPKGT